MEMIGFEKELLEQIYKLCSTRLCANSVGQVVTDVMVKPPQPGDPSYELFEKVNKKMYILYMYNMYIYNSTYTIYTCIMLYMYNIFM